MATLIELATKVAVSGLYREALSPLEAFISMAASKTFCLAWLTWAEVGVDK